MQTSDLNHEDASTLSTHAAALCNCCRKANKTSLIHSFSVIYMQTNHSKIQTHDCKNKQQSKEVHFVHVELKKGSENVIFLKCRYFFDRRISFQNRDILYHHHSFLAVLLRCGCAFS